MFKKLVCILKIVTLDTPQDKIIPLVTAWVIDKPEVRTSNRVFAYIVLDLTPTQLLAREPGK